MSDRRIRQMAEISIHAPAKGATTLMSRKKVRHGNFNPRSREGSDATGAAKSAKKVISIHAPAKGATIVSLTEILLTIYFNPRSREGSD